MRTIRSAELLAGDSNRKRLGIVGGMGPAATARLLARIVEFTDASCDQGHLDVTVLSRPQMPDRSAYLLGKPGAASFVEPMQQALRQLESLGCSVLATPCNTVHGRARTIASVLRRARFLSMVDETCGLIASAGWRKVGLAATEGTAATGVYGRPLSDLGIELVLPDGTGQRLLDFAIYGCVKAGTVPDAGLLAPLWQQFARAGCDGVVVGCTELSLLGLPTRTEGIALVDALDVLAASCVVACGAPLRYETVREAFDPSALEAHLRWEGGPCAASLAS